MSTTPKLAAGVSSHSCTIVVIVHALNAATLSMACVSYAGEMSACAIGAPVEQQAGFAVQAVAPAVNPVAFAMMVFLPTTLCAVTV